MDIIATSHISITDCNTFNEKLKEGIELLQNNGLDVEIQYSNGNDNGIIVYTALLIGRK